MARKRVSNQEVIDASKKIVADNNGKIEFEAWKAALNAELETDVTGILQSLLKKKTFILWLEGMGENGKPSLHVVDKMPAQEA